MAQSCIRDFRIGIFSKFRDIRMEIIQKLPRIECQIVDVTDEHGLTVYDIWNPDKMKQLSLILENFDIILGDVRCLRPIVNDLKSLKWLQSTSTGCNTILDHTENKDGKFILTRFAGSPTHQLRMVEYVIANIISFERNFKELYANQLSCFWDSSAVAKPFRQLSDLSICFLGLGSIGKALAAMCKNFGMKVSGVVSGDVSESERLPFVDKYYFSIENLPDILKDVDYVCNTLPKTPQTDNILSNDVLKNCQNKKTVLINIGRGNILSDDDIIRALENKWIGGAILDVFEEEPLPKTSQLWKMPNVILTPHCSAYPCGREIASVFVKNFLLFEEGKMMNYIVDWEKGY